MARRIVFVEFTPSGGLFQFAFQLAEALASGEDDVHLITGPSPELTRRGAGPTVHPVLPTWHPGQPGRPPRRAVRFARRAWRATRLLCAWLVLVPRLIVLRPDVVLWSAWRFGMDAVFVVLIDRLLPGATQAIIAHEPVPTNVRDTAQGKSGKIFDRLLGAAWRRMDGGFVLGTQARESVLRRWEPRGPVVVIPHGDEGSLRRAGALTRAEDTEPVALFFGTLTGYKGIDMLLDAFDQVRRRVPGCRLVMAGAVSEDVDLAAFSARAERTGGVDLRPGYVPAHEVHDLLASARLVVTPYRRASQSGVAHLAYTFGRPVVATDVGDLATVVHDGETGYLVPPSATDELADRMARLLEDPALAQRFGEAGRALLAATSSWTIVADRLRQGLCAIEASRERRGGGRAN